MMKKHKAFLIKTGKRIKVREICRGIYQDTKTLIEYDESEIRIVNHFHVMDIEISCRWFNIVLFGREYLRNNSWFIIPGISIDIVKGVTKNFYDLEIKFLFIGLGIRIATPNVKVQK